MALFQDQPGDEGLPGRQRLLAMMAIMMATAMAVIDGTIVNIALPNIARSLGALPGSAVWVSSSYLLVAAMLLAVYASLAKRVGFRTVFVAGAGLFTLSSLGCALSTTLPMLIFMRVLQGIGGAATMSIAPAIMRAIFPSRLIGRAIGLFAVSIALSTAIAPIIGGLLLAVLGWPWLFVINLPLGAAAVGLGCRVVPSQPSAQRDPFDVLGAVLSAIALGALVMTADALAHPQQGEPTTDVMMSAAACAVTALLAGIAFVIRESRTANPLIPLDIFESSRFSLAALTSMTSFISQGMLFIALPFLFQNVYGYSVLRSALMFVLWPVGIMLAAPRASRLADRYASAKISTAGLCCFAIGAGLLALLSDQASPWDIGARSLICGIGFGCFQSPNNREIMTSISAEHIHHASGVLAIMRIAGQCLGVAAIGCILSALAGSGSSVAQEMRGIHLGLWGAFAVSVLALTASASRWRSV